MCENNNVKLLLENGNKKIDLKIEGFSNTKGIVKQLFESFLDSMEDDIMEETKDLDNNNVYEAIEGAYRDTSIALLKDENLDVFKTSSREINIHHEPYTPLEHVSQEGEGVTCNISSIRMKNEKDNSIDFPSTDVDKYNKEFPKLKDAVSRNLYEKLTQLQLNQFSYFVTDKGELKLQARYSCKCGNFKKHWVVYPDGKKSARCDKCARLNTLVPVKGDFPSTDDFGNFFVTSNMIKRAEEKKEKENTYISIY